MPLSRALRRALRYAIATAIGRGGRHARLRREPDDIAARRGWSSQRHWHSHEDELVYILDGELVLVEDGGGTVLKAGDCAAFPKGSGKGHHMINRSSTTAVYLEAGSRDRMDLTTRSDVDMMSANADGRFVHKNGTPCPKP